jgi:hypothetical protein
MISNLVKCSAAGVVLAMASAFTPVASAQGNDPEMACVSALADKMAVNMNQIRSLGAKQAGEGTEVRLAAGKGRWNCYVNDSGEVTSFEEQATVAAPARRPTSSSPATLRSNCQAAAEKYLHLRPGDAKTGATRDVGDQVEIDATYYAQTVTCTVEKATGKVLNVG